MPPPLLQRNFDWISRFLFARSGVAEVPQAVIDVSEEWPKRWRTLVLASYTTAVGNTAFTIDVPETEHWLIDIWTLIGSFPATDSIQIVIGDGPASPGAFTFYYNTGVASSVTPILGMGFVVAIPVPMPGRLYLPPGHRLLINHTSVAGAVAYTHRVRRLVRLAYEPLL